MAEDRSPRKSREMRGENRRERREKGGGERVDQMGLKLKRGN